MAKLDYWELRKLQEVVTNADNVEDVKKVLLELMENLLIIAN